MTRTYRYFLFFLLTLLPVALVGPSFGHIISVRSVGAGLILVMFFTAGISKLNKFEIALIGFLIFDLLLHAYQTAFSPQATVGKLLIVSWYLVGVLVRQMVATEDDIRVIVRILQVQLSIVAVLTIQEQFTGVNYFSLINPNTIDTEAITRYGVERYQGPFGHAGPTAIFVASLIPICFVERSKRLMRYGVFLLGLTTLLVTQYRTAILALLLSFLALFFLRVDRTHRLILLIAGLAIPVVIAIFLLNVPIVSLAEYTYSSLQPGYRDPYSLSLPDRIDYWVSSLNYVSSIPFFGYGTGVDRQLLNNMGLINELPYPIFYAFRNGLLFAAYGFMILVGMALISVKAVRRRSADLISLRLAAFVSVSTYFISVMVNRISPEFIHVLVLIGVVQSSVFSGDRVVFERNVGELGQQRR